MIPILIGLSGFIGSGKDEATRFLISHFGYNRVALADPVRRILYQMNPIVTVAFSDADGAHAELRLQPVVDSYGWEWAKRNIPEVRRLMEAYATDAIRETFGSDAWVDVAVRENPGIVSPGENWVISDLRFANECEFVRNNNGIIIWIERPGVGSNGSVAESGIAKEYANVIIVNDSNIESLHKATANAISLATRLRRQ